MICLFPFASTIKCKCTVHWNSIKYVRIGELRRCILLFGSKLWVDLGAILSSFIRLSTEALNSKLFRSKNDILSHCPLTKIKNWIHSTWTHAHIERRKKAYLSESKEILTSSLFWYTLYLGVKFHTFCFTYLFDDNLLSSMKDISRNKSNWTLVAIQKATTYHNV